MNELQTKKNTGTVNDSQPPAERSGSPVPIAMPEAAPSGARLTLRTLRTETEMHAISYALEQTGWNRKRAAQLLSISYRGLLYKIRQHNITRERNPASVPKRAEISDTLKGWESPDLFVAGGSMGRIPRKD